MSTARAIQRGRGILNRDLTRPQLDALAVSGDALALLQRSVEKATLTARGYDRVRRVGRTIADLTGEAEVDESHIAEALALRGGW